MLNIKCKKCDHESQINIEKLRQISRSLNMKLNNIFLTTITENKQKFTCLKCNSKDISIITPKGELVEDGIRCNICLNCDEQIPFPRLLINPNASYCVECQEMLEHGEMLTNEENEEKIKCKRCSSEMVWRFRTKGGNGVYFLGCSNYPRCCFTMSK